VYRNINVFALSCQQDVTLIFELILWIALVLLLASDVIVSAFLYLRVN